MSKRRRLKTKKEKQQDRDHYIQVLNNGLEKIVSSVLELANELEQTEFHVQGIPVGTYNGIMSSTYELRCADMRKSQRFVYFDHDDRHHDATWHGVYMEEEK